MIKINLLPKEFQDKGKGLDWIILGYGVIVLMALGAMSMYFMKVQVYKRNLVKKDHWAAKLSEIKAKVARVEQLDGQKSVLNAKKNTVVQLFQGRILYPRFMETFFQNLPKEIWVTNITVSEDGQKNIKTTAICNSLTTDAIADWLQTMESQSDKFTDVSLSAIDVKLATADSRAGGFTFTMTFTYHPPAAPGT